MKRYDARLRGRGPGQGRQRESSSNAPASEDVLIGEIAAARNLQPGNGLRPRGQPQMSARPAGFYPRDSQPQPQQQARPQQGRQRKSPSNGSTTKNVLISEIAPQDVQPEYDSRPRQQPQVPSQPARLDPRENRQQRQAPPEPHRGFYPRDNDKTVMPGDLARVANASTDQTYSQRTHFLRTLGCVARLTNRHCSCRGRNCRG